MLNKLNSHIKLRKHADTIAKKVKDLQKTQMSKLSLEQLKEKTNEFRARLEKGETLSDILVEAYAVVCEACWRVLRLNPFQVQVAGAYIINEGDVAEMKTGEGKTLTSCMPIYLNALTRKGVHVTTVNEYLVQRDAEEMGQVFGALGLTVGVSLQKMATAIKKKAYDCDITYSVHSELGFDYLRDNMAEDMKNKTQRGHNFAIVDEVDSILIDEARTPLIISSQSTEPSETYERPDKFVKTLVKEDYEIDEESKGISLTPVGVEKAERHFKLDHLYDVRNTELTHRINNALKANYIFAKDVEYMVFEEKVLLIDQFTGRVMEGRSYSYGLQQAIQAKEGVKIEKETKTSATITYQNYFRLYNKLSGMTGTAKTEEEEFLEVYNMRVVEIPTNKPVIRKDDKDLIFGSKKAKNAAIVEIVKFFYEQKRPVLLGTTTVTVSEQLSKLLTQAGVVHNILNAKNHNLEAKIIENAGQLGAITIATNMAGRGTDIKIPEEVRKMGGLVVIGTEKHEARRIDNQLRGRSGRQGDPGYSQFYVSIEDDLMARFGGPMIKKIFSSLGNESINSKTLSRSLLSTQRRIEGMNFESRKNVLNYDNVLSNQRKVMYKQRDKILLLEDMKEIVSNLIRQVVNDFFNMFKKKEAQEEIIDYEKILGILSQRLIKPGSVTLESIKNKPIDDVKDILHLEIYKSYSKKREGHPDDVFNGLEKMLLIKVLDQIWMHHIDSMDKLRQGIHLQSISQKNPIQLYIESSHSLFEDTKKQIAHRCLLAIFAAEIRVNAEVEEKRERESREALERMIKEKQLQRDAIRDDIVETTGWGPQPTKKIEEEKQPQRNTDPTKGWT